MQVANILKVVRNPKAAIYPVKKRGFRVGRGLGKLNRVEYRKRTGWNRNWGCGINNFPGKYTNMRRDREGRKGYIELIGRHTDEGKKARVDYGERESKR